MMDWYFLLTPIAVLAALLLFRFVGCNEIFDLEETVLIDYYGAVQGDAPVINLRLQESPGATVANNEMGPPDGTYVLSPGPLDAGDPNWKSSAVEVPVLQLGVTDEPRLLATDPNSTSIRVHAGWVNFPPNWPWANTPLTEFTLEALVLPEWNLQDLGKYYCLMEVAPASQLGFGLFAGPDSDANSPYTWQFWVGSGLSTGFQRLNPKPYSDPTDLGPTLAAQPTYLAVTFSQSQSQAFLYMFYTGRIHTTYELEPPVPFVPVQGTLTIGIAGANAGPLFPPIPPSYHVLYPFWGRIAHVAIYNKVLEPGRILVHGMSAFSSY
jgi:hypothetical protein